MEPGKRRRNARHRERWPPPDPISKPGRIAGYTTAGCLVATSGAFLAASWDDLVCTHNCPFSPGLAALVWFIAVPIGLVGIAIARRVSLRPTQSDGPTNWTLSFVILFSAGVAVVATRLPGFTCTVGHLDANVRSGSRYGPPGGSTSPFRSPAIAWLFGFGWLLLDTVVRGVLR
jgi:hypothetical protein